MNDLIKIRDLSNKYDISARALRYYEDMGLITSVRSEEDDDINGRVYAGIINWLENSGFELDDRPGHRILCHMVNPTDEIKDALGYHQLDIYVPIKVRNKKNKTKKEVPVKVKRSEE